MQPLFPDGVEEKAGDGQEPRVTVPADDLPSAAGASLWGALLGGLLLLWVTPWLWLGSWLGLALLANLLALALARRLGLPSAALEQTRGYLLVHLLLGASWGGLAWITTPSSLTLVLPLLMLACLLIPGMAGSPPRAVLVFLAPALLPVVAVVVLEEQPLDGLAVWPLVVLAALLLAFRHRRQRQLAGRREAERATLRRELGDSLAQLAGEARHRREAQLHLADTQAKLLTVTERIMCAVCLIQDQRFVYSNPAMLAMTGYSAEEIVALPPWSLVDPRDRFRVRRYLVRQRRGLSPTEEIEFRIRPREGSGRWVSYSAGPLLTEGETVLLGIALDIQARRQAEATLRREREQLAAAMASIGNGVIMTDTAGRLSYLNPVAEEMCGWVLDEVQGQPVGRMLMLVDARQHRPVSDPVQACLEEGRVVRPLGYVQLLHRSGSGEFTLEVTVSPVLTEDSQLLGAVVVLNDVTQLHGLARLVDHRDSHDPITGLENRTAFESRLADAVEEARREDLHHVFCHLDLDNFRVVNDVCGHQGGDQLLQQLAQLLSRRIRRSDVLARLGGDEFGLLLQNCRLLKAEQIAENLRRAVQTFRFDWEGEQVGVTVSIGLVPISGDTRRMGKVLSAADLACYMAKDLGRNRVHVFASDDSVLAHRHGEKQWLIRIREALSGDRLLLYYQSAAALGKRHTASYSEVLLRMQGDDDTVITPGAFLPVAEHFQLMPEIDRWVVHNALKALADSGGSLAEVDVCAINLSGQSLNDESFLDFVEEEIEGQGVDHRRVCFEVSEATVLANMGRSIRFMRTLQERGCKFALDDFGSGFSSFSYLKNLPIDYLKIDGIFLRNIVSDSIDQAMVETINGMGHALGLATVAKFTRDRKALEILTELGVDYAQSFEVSRPEPVLPYRIPGSD